MAGEWPGVRQALTSQIVLLSGPLAVGKSAVAEALSRLNGFRKISSSGFLRSIAEQRDLEPTRRVLQTIGDTLDQQTNFRWLVSDVASVQIQGTPDQANWFVDAVRKPEQVFHFREYFPHVLHVHLTASEEILRKRFHLRNRVGDGVEDHSGYDIATQHPNELASRSVGAIADMVIDFGGMSPEDAAALIAARAGGGSDA